MDSEAKSNLIKSFKELVNTIPPPKELSAVHKSFAEKSEEALLEDIRTLETVASLRSDDRFKYMFAIMESQVSKGSRASGIDGLNELPQASENEQVSASVQEPEQIICKPLIVQLMTEGADMEDEPDIVESDASSEEFMAGTPVSSTQKQRPLNSPGRRTLGSFSVEQLEILLAAARANPLGVTKETFWSGVQKKNKQLRNKAPNNMRIKFGRLLNSTVPETIEFVISHLGEKRYGELKSRDVVSRTHF